MCTYTHVRESACICVFVHVCVSVCRCMCKCVQVCMCAFACIGQRTALAIISQQQPIVVFLCREGESSPFWSSSRKLRGLANSSKHLSVSAYPMALGWHMPLCPVLFLFVSPQWVSKSQTLVLTVTRHFTKSYYPSPWEV